MKGKGNRVTWCTWAHIKTGKEQVTKQKSLNISNQRQMFCRRLKGKEVLCVFLLVKSSTTKKTNKQKNPQNNNHPKTKRSVTFQSSSSHTEKNTEATEPPSSPHPSATSWCHSTAASSHERFAGPIRRLRLSSGASVFPAPCTRWNLISLQHSGGWDWAAETPTAVTRTWLWLSMSSVFGGTQCQNYSFKWQTSILQVCTEREPAGLTSD